MNSRISSCGKPAAMLSRDGGGLASAAGPASVAIEAAASRHLGHKPCGASGGMGALHLGQHLIGSVFIVTVPEEIPCAGYKKSEAEANVSTSVTACSSRRPACCRGRHLAARYISLFRWAGCPALRQAGRLPLHWAKVLALTAGDF